MIGHRIRLDVTDHQARTLARWCEAARLAWNWSLSERDRQFRDRLGGRGFIRRRGKWVPVGLEWVADPEALREDLSKLITRVRRKARLWWMTEPPARVYRSEVRTLAEAWKRCIAKLGRRPTPKRRATSFGLSNQDVQLDGSRVRLPKLGWLRLTERLRWRGKVKTVRVSFEAGSWYISLGTDWDRRRAAAPDVSAGVDVGLKLLAVVASHDGRVEQYHDNPRALRLLLRRLRRAGRVVSRRQRGSVRRGKAVARLARLHARVAAVRRDSTEKVSTAIARSVKEVGIEDLSISGMLRNGRMARAVSDASMGRLLGRLRVKVDESGGQVLVAPRSYASTRTCSACGQRTDQIPGGLAGLRVRRWTCEHCGAVHGRDRNAAMNLDPALLSGRMDAACSASITLAARVASFENATGLPQKDRTRAFRFGARIRGP